MSQKDHPYRFETMDLLSRLQKAGYILVSTNTGADEEFIDVANDADQARKEILSVDGCILQVTHKNDPNKRRLAILIILGNSPGELVNDYTADTGLDGVLQPFADDWFAGGGPQRMLEEAQSVLTGILTDQTGEDQYPQTKVKVEFRGGSLFIQPEGYGDFCSPVGEGTPLIVERFEGRLRVAIWEDINQEDSSHIIDLEGAREMLRLETVTLPGDDLLMNWKAFEEIGECHCGMCGRSWKIIEGSGEPCPKGEDCLLNRIDIRTEFELGHCTPDKCIGSGDCVQCCPDCDTLRSDGHDDGPCDRHKSWQEKMLTETNAWNPSEEPLPEPDLSPPAMEAKVGHVLEGATELTYRNLKTGSDRYLRVHGRVGLTELEQFTGTNKSFIPGMTKGMDAEFGTHWKDCMERHVFVRCSWEKGLTCTTGITADMLLDTFRRLHESESW